MRTVIALFLAVWLLAPSLAWSMTGSEFMALPTAKERVAEAEKQCAFLAGNGYKAVPEAYALTARMESLILDNGWQDKWIDWIGLTAAKDLGMHR